MELLLDSRAWIAFATLPALELVLGIDNIIFISILVDKLPPSERGRAGPRGTQGLRVLRHGVRGRGGAAQHPPAQAHRRARAPARAVPARLKLQRASFAFRIAFTCAGLALPCVAFITWPTRELKT